MVNSNANLLTDEYTM